MTDFEKLNIIVSESCKMYGVTETEIKSTRRSRNYVEPRQWICYFGEQLTKLTTGQIGTRIGKDHSSVLYSRNTMKNLIYYNDYADQCLRLREQIRRRINESPMKEFADHVGNFMIHE